MPIGGFLKKAFNPSKLGNFALGAAGKAAGAFLGAKFAKKGDDRAFGSGKRMFDYQNQQYQDMGLTPQEMVGAPGTGGGQGTTANFGNQFEMQPLIQSQQLAFEAEQKALDRKNALDIAHIQYGEGSPADRTADATMTKVQQDKMRLEFEQMHKTREFKIALERHQREQTTQSADFLIFMKLLGMGPDNLRTSVVAVQLKKQGYEILNEKGELIPEKDFMKIMNLLRTESSSTYREIFGAITAGEDVEKKLNLRDAPKKVWDALGDSIQIERK